MFWRKQRSRSPPRLTSSTPEVEHHLVAMHTALPQPPIDTVESSASAASSDPQDQITTSVSSSDAQADTDINPQGTTLERDGDLPTWSQKNNQILKARSIRVKAELSRPRLLSIIACVSYLLFHLMGVSIGLRALQGYTEPRLRQAEIQLKNTVLAFNNDYLLDIQLANLLDTTLDQRFLEASYEHCLARGLHKADRVFRGLDFTSDAHVRNQTMDWVTSNCRRLMYTPQVHSPRASKLRSQLTKIEQSIEEILRIFQHRVAMLQSKLQGGNLTNVASRESATNANKDPRVLPNMPFEFSLECHDRVAHCRLVHSGPTTPYKTGKTLMNAVTHDRKEVEKWTYKFEPMYFHIGYLSRPLALLQPLIMMCYILATMISLRRPQSTVPNSALAKRNASAWRHICHVAAHLHGDERHAVGLIINTALYALLNFQLKYIIPEFDRLLLPVGLGFCIFHSVHAALFIDLPHADFPDESMYHIARAVKDLCLIAQGIEIAEPTPVATLEKPTCAAAKPASKIATRFISPLTSIAEDLQQERRAMHAERDDSWGDVDLQGYATETDDQSDEADEEVECSSYIDLAGGATPTESDDDLVVVEE